MTHPTTQNLQAMYELLAGALNTIEHGNPTNAIPALAECIERLEAMGISGVHNVGVLDQDFNEVKA